MNPLVGGAVIVLLGAAAVLALIRLVRGPSTLDRAVAVDMLLAVVLAAVAAEATLNRHTTTVPVLLALALVGFLGSVSIVRFSAREGD
ncbi:monovalent cation/H+ antiporter complex subunit F [Embleya scabrispora]|uniref:monovalent cation/H+ antiporter complex subunit F n=1 Tax=Embleya scabrispora TaxID=159449 RepID=UPI0003785751|nr:monovalent cation/H+ antiporter complex subunit F [Embleya scabrispora]MYS83572.1 cation:proton antiporter [Streptomyces sp. SID5474]